ncbi:hypothetical protein [Roseibium alexandrii]|uniref:Uncharacterized protein n=1 Tax=Roseibium alexandrii TaxID=388408 RepID=A0A0M7AT29_9HYPH|nr:hypothetical protein [Roseibium alexandrii]CTQ77420.1 hypothetical protein LAX5112_04904 [Roseibium alexandrii]
MTILQNTLNHLLENVIPASQDYIAAEEKLSRAFNNSPNRDDPHTWQKEAAGAKRNAANLAIAIDGLADRAAKETGISKSQIRRELRPLCLFGAGGYLREDAHDRVRGVANIYKHDEANDTSIPISSSGEVLAVGLGYGLDAFGVGKMSGPEVLVGRDPENQKKFLGDFLAAITAWFAWLHAKGVDVSDHPVKLCGVQVNPAPVSL